MRFTTNTKPLADALALGIINANVSNYHKKSNIAQVQAKEFVLKINLEATGIRTELTLGGKGEGEPSPSIFVSSLQLKQLVATLDSPSVTLEFADDGLTIYSGKSKFTLPKVVDADELELEKPSYPNANTHMDAIDKTDWKFIKDNQMYAIAMSFLHPVYTKVWIGSDSDVLVGDFDSGLFTHSKHNKLNNQCLLADTIVNLFTSLPDGAKMTKLDKDYLIYFKCDSFEYITQFKPMYEEDEGVGDYNSAIFLNTLKHPSESITVTAAQLTKILSQAELLSSSSTDDTISFGKSGDELCMKARNVDCKVPVTSQVADFTLDFKTDSLRKVLSSYGESAINIAPLRPDPEGPVAGILVWDNELTTCIAGVE